MESRWELILMDLITERLNNRSMNLQLDQVQLYNITPAHGERQSPTRMLLNERIGSRREGSWIRQCKRAEYLVSSFEICHCTKGSPSHESKQSSIIRGLFNRCKEKSV